MVLKEGVGYGKKETKDNVAARRDLKLYCRKRKGVEYNERAYYTLDKNQKKVICQWVEKLRFPNGYVSNLRRCVDVTGCRLFGMKSHDCHVFMQRLMTIAFHEMLPQQVWEALTEFNIFFKTLTATSITPKDLERIETEIPIILCKLETIFVFGIFNSMEHLPVHLPYKVKIAGHVQYRWMYPFERFVWYIIMYVAIFVSKSVEKDVKNKARVEGSVVNAYLLREASIFCFHYFETGVPTRNRKLPRNDDE
uniref:DUF4218 domain-containing protein n=1 Tax=Lactuca sativa TaxID=4236 RepID=A0A9R1V6A0_LACSA|nr:hypothetical protein LSAT_V11C600330190 [Lactuca sativa]